MLEEEKYKIKQLKEAENLIYPRFHYRYQRCF